MRRVQAAAFMSLSGPRGKRGCTLADPEWGVGVREGLLVVFLPPPWRLPGGSARSPEAYLAVGPAQLYLVHPPQLMDVLCQLVADVVQVRRKNDLWGGWGGAGPTGTDG